MRRRRHRAGARGWWTTVAAAALVHALVAAAAADLPVITGVDLISPHQLPEAQVRAAIGDLIGQALSRDAVRASLDRLWALGLFPAARVHEVAEPGGIRLRYELSRRPLIRRIRWDGRAGIDIAEVAGVAALAIGEEASEERLGQARRQLLARYRAEGYFAAQVDIRADPVPQTNERDLAVVLQSGQRARIGAVRIQGDTGVSQAELTRWLKLKEGSRFSDVVVKDRTRALEERLRNEGFYAARVIARAPQWVPTTNRVDLE